MSDDFFFDPRGIKSESLFEVIPEGQYIAIIDKATKKHADNANGVKIYFKIVHGAYEGKVVMDYFNITHFNPGAQRIGRQNFASFLDCIGMGSEPIKQESELENKILKIEVEKVPHYKNFGILQNKIKRYHPLNSVDQNLIKDFKIDEKQELESMDMPF